MKALPTTTLRSFKDYLNELHTDTYTFNPEYHHNSNSIDVIVNVKNWQKRVKKVKICTITNQGYYFYFFNLFNQEPSVLSKSMILRSYIVRFMNQALGYEPNSYLFFDSNYKFYYLTNHEYRHINLSLPFFIDSQGDIYRLSFTFFEEYRNWLSLLLVELFNKDNDLETIYKLVYYSGFVYYAILRVNEKGELILSCFIQTNKFECINEYSVKTVAGVKSVVDGHKRSKKVLNKYPTGLSSTEAKVRFAVKLDVEKFNFLFGEHKLSVLSEIAKYEQ